MELSIYIYIVKISEVAIIRDIYMCLHSPIWPAVGC